MEESRADRARRRRRQHPSKQRIGLALGQEKTREGASITSSSGNNSARHDKLRDGGTDGGVAPPRSPPPPSPLPLP